MSLVDSMLNRVPNRDPERNEERTKNVNQKQLKNEFELLFIHWVGSG